MINNIKYEVDDNTTNKAEHWNFAFETLERGTGDCEDGAILLANLLLHSNIPYWKVRIATGWVILPDTNKKVGHAYLTYYCEEKDYWILCDWCYYPNQLPINQRKDYKNEENYYDVWFSFNKKYAYAKDNKHLKKFEN